jgi:hypothetical protein
MKLFIFAAAVAVSISSQALAAGLDIGLMRAACHTVADSEGCSRVVDEFEEAHLSAGATADAVHTAEQREVAGRLLLELAADYPNVLIAGVTK